MESIFGNIAKYMYLATEKAKRGGKHYRKQKVQTLLPPSPPPPPPPPPNLGVTQTVSLKRLNCKVAVGGNSCN